MRKIIRWVLLILIVLIVAALVGVHFFLGDAIRKGVVTLGPQLTKVDVKLDKVSVSILSGAGSFNGLVIGNPQGFSTPAAIKVNSASVSIKPASLLSDKIVIESINVVAPEITYELSLSGDNLHKILANVEASAGATDKNSAPASSTPATGGKPAKKLQVDDFFVTGGRVYASAAGATGSIPLPTIHVKDLGKDADGITEAELAKRILSVLIDASVKEGSKVIADLGKGATYIPRDLGGVGTNTTDKVTKGIGDLFSKPKK